MEKQVMQAFPTLIGRFKAPDAGATNAELRRLILERERSESNQQHANAGGWHSKADLLTWPSPAVKTLQGWIMEAVNHMVSTTMEIMRAGGLDRPFDGSLSLSAWANISRKTNYHRMHNHPMSCWSGVYYVEMGSASTPGYPLSGVLDLLDPRPFTEMTPVPGEPYGQKLTVRPEPGLMVLFPGFLYHFANPYFGEGERISVAFNVKTNEKRA